MTIQTPYQKFAFDFTSLVNSKNFTNSKIKIFQLQTGGGKSYFQDKEMPIVLKEAFPDLKYIFRLSPTNEVANDGTFTNVEELNGKYIFSNIGENERVYESILRAWKNVPNGVLCISCTHTYFTVNFERLLKYAPHSVLCVEEAHQYIGCGDGGSKAYVTTFGYTSEYDKKTVEKIELWGDVNPRIIGFTATPTRHHKGDESLSDKFEICSELASLEDILPSQAWINDTKEYRYEKKQGKDSVRQSIEESIDTVFSREEELLKLVQYDNNIIPKLSGLFIAGDRRGVWGCAIDDVREVISEYLLSIGYEGDDKMIATMVEDSSGGVSIYNLKGESETVRGGSTELFDRLQNPEDPVRFLIVINRGRSGINVHNLTTCVVCRIRDPKEVRTPIPIQIFGRMVRLNTGTGSIVRKKYINHLYYYLENYSKDYGVDMDTVIKTIKIANIFDIWYPENPKAKRTWKDSLQEFRELYVNSVVNGYEYLQQYEEDKKPVLSSFVTYLPDFDVSPVCPYCHKLIEDQIDECVMDVVL